MAIQHYYTVLCEQIIEAKDGRHSLINLYDNVILQQVPGALLRMWALIEVDADDGDEFMVTVDDEQGATVCTLGQGTIGGELCSEITRRKKSGSVGHIHITVGFGPVVFQKLGAYSVVLRSGNRVLHRRQFGVVQQASEGS